MGKIWAIFSDSTACEIKLNKTSADENNELVLNPVSIDNQLVKNSAKKALNAAFDALKNFNRIKSDNYSFSFEFKGLFQVVEASASLSFALALVNKFSQFPFSIAATGVIVESSKSTEIQPINSIKEKLNAAMSVLDKGDIIFYPSKNHAEIPIQLADLIQMKGVALQQVDTVEDAIIKLYRFNNENAYLKIDEKTNDHKRSQKKNNHSNRNKRFFHLLWFVCFICLIIYLFVPYIYDNQSNNDPFIYDHKRNDHYYDMNISNNREMPQEKKTIQKIEINTNDLSQEVKPRLNRIKLELSGENKNVVAKIKDQITRQFQTHDFVINNQSYDGIVSGQVFLSDLQETPLRPYAPPDAIIVTYNIVIQNILFISNNGDQIKLGTIEPIPKIIKGGRSIRVRWQT